MAKKEAGVEMSDVDVENVAIGDSSTKWGGSNSGSKAKAVLRADLHCDRNQNSVGPFGAPKYGVAKKGELNK